MSNVIDSFLVALGFKVDDDSAKESKKAIDEMRGTALKMGAALSGAFLGADLAAKSATTRIHEVSKASKLLANVGVSELDKLRHAFTQAGGSPEDAESTLKSFESIIEGLKIGEKAVLESVAKLGIPTEFITDSRTSLELFQKLAHIFDQLSPERQGALSGALGLNRGADLLFREGSQNIDKWLSDAQKLGAITQEMADNADEATRATNELERATNNLFNTFATAANPGITEARKVWTETIQEFVSGFDILGELFGDNYKILAPSAAVSGSAVAITAAGKAATAAGAKSAGAAVTAAGSSIIPAAATGLFGYNLYRADKDVEALGLSWLEAILLPHMHSLNNIKEVFSGLRVDANESKMIPAGGQLIFDKTELSTDSSRSGLSGNTYHIRNEISVLESVNPDDTARKVVEEINRSAESAAESFVTSTAG